MSEALIRATAPITVAALSRMLLRKTELPPALQDFLPSRADILDNDTLAQQGFSDSSAARFHAMGRITGHMREFLAPVPEDEHIPVGYDLAAATVVHLFEDAQSVSRWIEEIFLGDFEAHVGQEVHPDQQLLAAERLPFHGFADGAVGLRVLQSSPEGPVSSTVVDFRLGRLLGVAYVATLGNCERRDLVERLGQALERKIVHVVLEAS